MERQAYHFYHWINGVKNLIMDVQLFDYCLHTARGVKELIKDILKGGISLKCWYEGLLAI